MNTILLLSICWLLMAIVNLACIYWLGLDEGADYLSEHTSLFSQTTLKKLIITFMILLAPMMFLIGTAPSLYDYLWEQNQRRKKYNQIMKERRRRHTI